MTLQRTSAIAILSGLCAASPAMGQDLLLPSGQLPTDYSFGRSIRLVENRLVVFAHSDDVPLNELLLHEYDIQTLDLLNTYSVPGSTWASNDLGARSIDIEGERVLVGAEGTHNDRGLRAGDVYLFDPALGGSPMHFEPIAGAGESRENERFGTAVAIEGDRVVASGPGDRDNGVNSGSVYVFDASSQNQLKKIKAADAQRDTYFGLALAVEDGVIAVGAPGNDNPGIPGGIAYESGAVYLYDLYTYQLLHQITPSNPVINSGYGSTVAMGNGYLAVGVPKEREYFGPSDGYSDYHGAVYVYDIQSGQELYNLLPDVDAGNAYFGTYVAISDDTLVVGARSDNDGAGSASVYRLSSGQLIAELGADESADADQVGRQLDVHGGRVAVNYHIPSAPGFTQGVYTFNIGPCSVADLAEPYFELNFFDVSAFLSAYIAESDEADINGDGMFDFFDVSQFLTAYNGGCP